MSGRPRRPRRPRRTRRETSRPVRIAGAGILIAALLAVIAWAVLWFTPLATVENIEVEGVVHGDAAAITEASGVTTGEQLARVDTGAAARNIASEPWVERATVGRGWPSTVQVEITEHVPAAFIRATDGEHLFTADGVEFLVAPPPEGTVEFARIPRVDDPEPGKLSPRPEVMEAALDVLAALPERVRAETARIDAPGAAEVTVMLHDGREIHFGSADRAEEKGRAAEIVMDREGQRWTVANPAEPALRN